MFSPFSNDNFFKNGDDGRTIGDPPPSKTRALELKQLLREFKNDYYLLSKDDKIIYDMYNEELMNIQKNCFHSWNYCELFNHVKAICEHCDFEDTNYRHTIHYKKLPAGRRS